MASTPSIQLGSTDRTVPLIGFGTAEFPFAASTSLIKESVLHAIKLGYRHFDTAAIYNCEQYLGEAISDALNLGLIKSREELFLTSKLWCSDAHADRVVAALTKTLKNIKLDYLDLYLIHFPVSLKPSSSGPAFPFEKKDLVHMDIESVWKAMEECQRLGLAKSIGVSNFSCKKLEMLLTTAKIPPAVNQVEMSPLWQQKNQREFCKEKGIHVTAYSPLGGQGTPWGTNQILENEILKKISEAKGKTVAQICLRWVHEQGVSLVVKSFNKERMKQNVDIFDWTLKPEESHLISQIPQRRAFPALQFIHDKGPFASVEDFWDGEV